MFTSFSEGTLNINISFTMMIGFLNLFVPSTGPIPSIFTDASISALPKRIFFRYAILFKTGGVYLDMDSLNIVQLDKFILPTDSALISLEKHLEYYVQWALVFEAGHPFLEKTLEIVMDNLQTNRYPRDVHAMTGPGAYTQAIKECLKESSTIQYRELGCDYEGNFKFHYRFSKFFLYGAFRKNYWRTQQLERPLLKDEGFVNR